MQKVDSQSNAAGIRRITDDRASWRVAVETWPERDGFHGRLVFTAERDVRDSDRREGPDALRGDTREDVIAEAHELPEATLRQVFRSLA